MRDSQSTSGDGKRSAGSSSPSDASRSGGPDETQHLPLLTALLQQLDEIWTRERSELRHLRMTLRRDVLIGIAAAAVIAAGAALTVHYLLHHP